MTGTMIKGVFCCNS